MDKIECTLNNPCAWETSAEKLLEAIKQFCEYIYEMSEIFIANPFDLIEIDMSKIPQNCYFMSEHYMDRGKMLRIVDKELKRDLYKFIEEHPDRAFRGEKHGNL